MTALSLAASIYMAFSAPGPPEGPKIGDTKVQTSTYGKVIPIGFGRMRLAGNIIWALELEEVKKKVSVGGKGGGGKQTVYRYFAHFAVGLTEGPAVACSRIWADKKIIFDQSGRSAVKRKYEFAAFRFYTGSAAQLPDPMIEADIGVGSTPAYRGRTYMVIQDLPVADMGNRIPHMEFEVQFSTPVEDATVELPGMFDWAMLMAMEDTTSGYLYFIRRHDIVGGGESRSIGYLDLYTDTVLENTTAFPYANQLLFGANGFKPSQVLPGPDGRVYVLGRATNGSWPALCELNPVTLDLWSVWNLADSFDLTNQLLIIGANTWVVQAAEGTWVYSIAFFNGFAGSPPDIDNDKWLVWDRGRIAGGLDSDHEAGGLGADIDGKIITPVGIDMHTFKFDTGSANDDSKGPIWVEFSCADDEGILWVIGWADNDKDMAKGLNDARGGKLWRVKVTGGENVADMRVKEYDLPTLDPEGRIHKPSMMIFDHATRTLTIWGGEDPDGDYSVLQYSIKDKKVINRMSYTLPSGNQYHPDEFTSGGGFPAGTGLKEGHLTYFQKGTNMMGEVYYPERDMTAVDKWVVYNAWNFTWTANQPGPYIVGKISEQYWHKDSDKVYVWNGPGTDNNDDVNPEVYYRWLVIDSVETLDVIVKALIADVGVDTAALVATDATMAATSVEGFIVGSQGSVRSAIDPLGFAFFFDAVESGGKIAFRSRSAASIRTIPQDDLGAKPGTEGQGETDVLITERMQETDIPSRVDLVYMDITRNFQEGNQHAQRMENPSPTQFSNSVFSNAVPIAMSPDQAKIIAEAKLYDSWAARLAHKFQFGPKHLDLEPTDIITVGVDGSPTVLMRLAQTQIGEAFVTRAEGVTHDPETFDTVGTGALAEIVQDLLIFQGPTEAFLMDIPLLLDSHDADGLSTGVYVAMGGMREGWVAGFITRSKNGLASGKFEHWESSRGESPWGYLTEALAAQPDLRYADLLNTVAKVFTRMDHDGEIKVKVIGGEDQLESVTHEELWEGGLNAAVMINVSDPSQFEIFQYQTVSITDGVATLTDLLRGLRGSEEAGKTGWGLNTRVVFLDPDITTRKQIDLVEIDDDWVYSVETARATQNTVRQLWFTARGNDLKPYPVGWTWMIPAAGDRSSSSVQVSGYRRTRLGGEADFEGGVEFIKWGETIEAYEMDLIHKTTGEVDRTYTGVTSYLNGFTVTTGHRSSAGYGADEEFTVRVYQMSEAVGRGLVREITG